MWAKCCVCFGDWSQRSRVPGTSMISQVKGKAEISHHLLEVFPLLFWSPTPCLIFLLFSFGPPISGDQTSIFRLREKSTPFTRDWVWVNPPASKHHKRHAATTAHTVTRTQGLAGKSMAGTTGYVCLWQQAALVDLSATKGVPLRSTVSMYSTNLRATANVAWLRLLRTKVFSCKTASSEFHRGARLAASTNMVCKYLLRFLDIGPRCSLPADLCRALHKPQ